jgi:hypothetical protein
LLTTITNTALEKHNLVVKRQYFSNQNLGTSYSGVILVAEHIPDAFNICDYKFVTFCEIYVSIAENPRVQQISSNIERLIEYRNGKFNKYN